MYFNHSNVKAITEMYELKCHNNIKTSVRFVLGSNLCIVVFDLKRKFNCLNRK